MERHNTFRESLAQQEKREANAIGRADMIAARQDALGDLHRDEYPETDVLLDSVASPNVSVSDGTLYAELSPSEIESVQDGELVILSDSPVKEIKIDLRED